MVSVRKNILINDLIVSHKHCFCLLLLMLKTTNQGRNIRVIKDSDLNLKRRYKISLRSPKEYIKD